MRAKWREIASSRNARLFTIVLLTLQIGGCAADMTMTGQGVLESLFCLATSPNNEVLEWAIGVIWLILGLSWIVGLFALRYAQLRPLYWALIILAPIAYVGQLSLLHRHALYCDGP